MGDGDVNHQSDRDRCLDPRDMPENHTIIPYLLSILRMDPKKLFMVLNIS